MADLERFHVAQRGVYETALAELRAGEKRTHWMWFILPQIVGLGRSPMAQRYAISDLQEARDYLADPMLGARLKACVAAALEHRDRSVRAILGQPDDMKFRSCLTLFEAAAPHEPLFGEALDTFYQGERDPETLKRLTI